MAELTILASAGNSAQLRVAKARMSILLPELGGTAMKSRLMRPSPTRLQMLDDSGLYKKAGVEKPAKPIHCLRHTFGTESAASGMPLPVLKELMGHSMIETTMRYVHVNEQQMRAEIARVFNRPAKRVAGIGSKADSG